jgi:hypothetical protein
MDSQCDDGISCTGDTCESGVCVYTPNCSPCFYCNTNTGACEGVEPSCGDDCCSPSENYCNCSQDCEPSCGDGCCSSGECSTCPGDCGERCSTPTTCPCPDWCTPDRDCYCPG